MKVISDIGSSAGQVVHFRQADVDSIYGQLELAVIYLYCDPGSQKMVSGCWCVGTSLAEN